jgi:hypothetical protein
VHLDQHGQIVGRDGVVNLPAALQQEVADQPLAFVVEIARLVEGSLGKAARVVTDHLHHANLLTPSTSS